MVPAEWAGKRVGVRFDGVYMLSTVWVNGEKGGAHAYGYTPFSIDLTGKVKAGGENVVAVRVDNSKQVNSRWYSGSGIEGHVWVEVDAGAVRIERDGVVVRTVSASEKEAKLEFKVEAVSDGGGTEAEVGTEIFAMGKDGKAAGEAVVGILPEKLALLGAVWVTEEATLREPRLWSPESPSLYVAVTTMSVGGKVVDRRETVFGVRTVEVSAEKGFLLNGQRVVLYGGMFSS